MYTRFLAALGLGLLSSACNLIYVGEDCGPGTHEVDNVCQPNGTGVDAGPPGRPGLTCGPGTHEVNGQCLPSGPGDPQCGPGTHEENGECVPTTVDAGPGLTCGPGTHEVNHVCVADGLGGLRGYELRVQTTVIPADGHSKFPVLAIGTHADGSPAQEMVVLGTSRGAGSFIDATITLAPLGTTAYFVPCNAATAGCTGPLTLTLALASAPTVPVASIDVQLVQPTGVGTAAPCLTGGNVMFFDGNDYIYNGMLTVSAGSWQASGSSNALRIYLTPAGQNQGLWWDFDFNTTQLGVPLAPGVYEGAERAAFASPDHPGMDVGGDGRGCNMITGRFEVHDFEAQGSTIKKATISFEQHCEGGSRVLNGCVHYQQ